MAYEQLNWVDMDKAATPKVARAFEEYAIAYSSVRKSVDALSSAYAEHLEVTSLMIGWKNGPERLSYALTSKSKPVEKTAKPTKPAKAAKPDTDTQAMLERIAMLERALSLKAQAFEEPDDEDEDEDEEPEPVKPVPVRRKKR